MLIHWLPRDFDVEVLIRKMLRAAGKDCSTAACKTWAREFIIIRAPRWPAVPLTLEQNIRIGDQLGMLLASMHIT